MRKINVSKENIERLLSVLQLICSDTQTKGSVDKGLQTLLTELEIPNAGRTATVIIKEGFISSKRGRSFDGLRWVGPIPPNYEMAKRIINEVRKLGRNQKDHERKNLSKCVTIKGTIPTNKHHFTTEVTDKATPTLQAVGDAALVKSLIAEKAKLNQQRLDFIADIDKKVDAINTVLAMYNTK